jgi:hypothetical protein
VQVLHRVRARNLATASANKIHDDEVAQRYGFAGGLVPGVDVYAYATHAIVEQLGAAWLTNGSATLKLVHPVYDGRRTTVEVDRDAGPSKTETSAVGAIAVVVRDESGNRCAEVTARLGAGERPQVERAIAALPKPRPRASSTTLSEGTVLGTLIEAFDAQAASEYLAAISEDLSIYTESRVAHPGWLLRRANQVLAGNVELGPWIHVGSDVRSFDSVHDGERVCTRARVVREWERRGHRFVTLDVQVTAGPDQDERAIVHVVHTAIYEPRTQDLPK